MKLSERLFAVGLLTTALGVACTGGVMPVQVGGPGPSDSEPDEGKPPGGGMAGKEQTSAQTSGSGPTTTTTTTAQGPTSTGSNTTTTVSSTGSGGCTENVNCLHCFDCLQTPTACGTPQTAATKVCKCNTPSTSLAKWSTFYACICGTGTGGLCGTSCTKTCTGAGTDQATCQNCLAGAVSGACMSSYSACNMDGG